MMFEADESSADTPAIIGDAMIGKGIAGQNGGESAKATDRHFAAENGSTIWRSAIGQKIVEEIEAP
jgi:hypothetical protein